MGAERLLPVLMKVMDRGVARTVRVGQAAVSDDGVVLTREPMRLGGLVEEANVSAPALAAARPASRHSRLEDLEWLAQRSRRVLDDPKKERWHADMRVQLAQIEEEMERLKRPARAPAH